jgi:hypothetical protein
MKKGDIVKIFEKPLSEEGYEGSAKLIKKIKGIDLYNGLILERWEVEFESDFFRCERLIAYGEKK